MRILIVEDNQKLAGYIQKAFRNQGYAADCVYDGETAEARILSHDYDLVVLDIMLPKKDGYEVCKNLRVKNVMLPIIMLTAKNELSDKVEGLDSGADDYLAKPFELDELLARVRALLRRPAGNIGKTLDFLDIKLDSAKHKIWQSDREIILTLKEFSVLEYLILNKGQVLTRDQILDHCWEFGFDSFSNIVDVYIKRLRHKLKDHDEKYIKTVRGIGYQI